MKGTAYAAIVAALGMTGAVSAQTEPRLSIVGSEVETPTGEEIASVADVVRDANGAPRYLLITNTRGQMTVMPYTAASAMLEDDVLVVDRAKLEAAPKLKPDELAARSITTASQRAADNYWSKEIRTASPERSARPRG